MNETSSSNRKISRLGVGLQGSLRERFGIAANQAHRALDDCLIMRQVVNSHLLRLNNTATIADVMGQNSKCSGSFGDLQERGMTQICITNTIKQMHHMT